MLTGKSTKGLRDMAPAGKLPTLILLIVVASLTAALFGALLNQLSYSIGPTYFEALKFPQFGISTETSPRWGAALVGLQSSWFTGILIGLPAFLYGLIAVPRAQSYLAAGLGAVGLVLVLALFAALSGLLGGLIADTTGLLDSFIILPEGPTRSDVLRAGFMHDAGYASAILGALLAFWPMRRARAIDRALADRASDAAPAAS